MNTDYNKWDKLARDEVAKAEQEEKDEKKISDNALGLSDGPKGPPTEKAEKERKEQEQQNAVRSDIIKKMEQTELKIRNPENGVINAMDENNLPKAIRIIEAHEVQLTIKGKSLKVFIENCSNTHITIEDHIFSSTVEINKCQAVVVDVHEAIATIQIDGSDDCTLEIKEEEMCTVYYDNCVDLELQSGSKSQVFPKKEWQCLIKWNREEEQWISKPVQRDAEKNFVTNDGNGATTEDVGETGPSNEAQALALKEQGNNAFRSNDFTQAAAYYTQSIALAESDVVLCNRSQCWLKMGQLERAFEDAEQAAKLNPENKKAYFRQGMAVYAMKKYREAMPLLTKAEELDPKNLQIKESIKMCQFNIHKLP